MSAKLTDFMAVDKNSTAILGKLLYFSLADILIEREKLEDICQAMSLPVTLGKRLSPIDSFRRATTAIKQSSHAKANTGRPYKVYCRDNERASSSISRELVKETLGTSTNRYKKLANIALDKVSEVMSYEVSDFDGEVDTYSLMAKAEENYALYKRCAGLSQIESMVEGFLAQMDSTKISIHGRLYFVPRKHESMVNLFEDFIGEIDRHNLNNGSITVNSIYMADDEKQRSKMANEFLSSTRSEIQFYLAKVDHLISTGCESLIIIDRWLNRIHALEAKKRMYEDILRTDLSNLGEEYENLRFMADELSARAIMAVKKSA